MDVSSTDVGEKGMERRLVVVGETRAIIYRVDSDLLS